MYLKTNNQLSFLSVAFFVSLNSYLQEQRMENLLNSQGYQHIVENIFLNLDLTCLLQVSFASKNLNGFVSTNSKFWFNICRRKNLLEENWLKLVKVPKNTEVNESFIRFFKNLLMLDKIENDWRYQEIEKLANRTFLKLQKNPQFSSSIGNLVFGQFKEPNNKTVYKMFWYHKNKTNYHKHSKNSHDFCCDKTNHYYKNNTNSKLAMFLFDKVLIDFIRETIPDIEANDLFTTGVLRLKYKESNANKCVKSRLLAKLFSSLIENPNPTFEDGTTLKDEIKKIETIDSCRNHGYQSINWARILGFDAGYFTEYRMDYFRASDLYSFQ